MKVPLLVPVDNNLKVVVPVLCAANSVAGVVVPTPIVPVALKLATSKIPEKRALPCKENNRDGDGTAAERIVKILRELHETSTPKS